MNKIKLKFKKTLIGKKPIVIMLHSIDYLNDSCTISFDNFVSFIERFQEEIKNKKIIITFDDGFESVYTKCFKYLFERNLPFVCFLITDFIDKPHYLSKQQICEMLETGLLTIGSHGKTHLTLNKLDNANIKNEIVQSKKILEMTFGVPILLFAYSHGIFNKKSIQIIKKANYRFAYVATSNLSDFLFPGNYKIPRYNLKNETINNIVNEISFYEKKSV